MEQKNIDQLKEAFRCAVNLNTAQTYYNHSTCGSFHIAPFNTTWDKKTVEEVMYRVQLYVNTWIVYPMSEALELDPKDITTANLIRWHEEEARRLKNQLNTK